MNEVLKQYKIGLDAARYFYAKCNQYEASQAFYIGMFALNLKYGHDYKNYLEQRRSLTDRIFIRSVLKKTGKLRNVAIPIIKEMVDKYLIMIDGIFVQIKKNDLEKLEIKKSNNNLFINFPILDSHIFPGVIIRSCGKAKKSEKMVTLYLNISSEQLNWFLIELGDKLESKVDGVTLKALGQLVNYDRYDSATIFCWEEDLEEIVTILKSSIKENNIDLLDQSPFLTHRIEKGISLAFQPLRSRNGLSNYGEWLSSIFMDAVIKNKSNDDIDFLKKSISNEGRLVMNPSHFDPNS